MLRKLTVALSVAGFATAAGAAQWSIDPSLGFRVGYNDNIRLTSTNEVSTGEASLSPDAIFSVATPSSGISGQVRFDFRRYEESSDLDENNSLFRLASHYNLETSVLGLDLASVNDTTLDSQLEETGVALERIRRSRLSATPYWTWMFSETTNLRFSYGYSTVDYHNAAGTGYVDYTVNSPSVTLTRQFNERTSASITLSGTRTDNENDVQSTNGNLQAGLTYNFSETLSASLYGGVRHTQVDYASTSFIPIYSGSTLIGFVPLTQDVSRSDWGGTFSGGIKKIFLRGDIGLSASRDISNSINGTPIEVDKVRLDNSYRFSETLTGRLSLELYHSKARNAIGQDLDSNYYQIAPELSWKLRRSLELTGSYRYRQQAYASTDSDAVQNAAYLTLTYQWPRIAVSR